jgi:hypothetical protein
VGADVIIVGQEAPPSDLESRDPPRRKGLATLLFYPSESSEAA